MLDRGFSTGLAGVDAGGAFLRCFDSCMEERLACDRAMPMDGNVKPLNPSGWVLFQEGRPCPELRVRTHPKPSGGCSSADILPSAAAGA